MDVVVVGSLHLDVVVDAPHFPRVDETVAGTAVAYRFGGKGGNQAVAAARYGARTFMVGMVGDDQFGRQILAELDVAGVDREQVGITNGASGMSVAIVDDRGDYVAAVVSGVNASIRPDEIDVSSSAAVVLVQNEIDEAVNVAVAQELSDDATLVLNAAPARAIDATLLKRVDVLIVNRVEAESLVGSGSFNPPNPELVDRLAGLGPDRIVVTLGAEGAMLWTRAGGARILPAHTVSVVSTHGAGDNFIGALAAELATGKALEDSVHFAQTATALYISRTVDSRSTLTRDDIAALTNLKTTNAKPL